MACTKVAHATQHNLCQSPCAPTACATSVVHVHRQPDNVPSGSVTQLPQCFACMHQAQPRPPQPHPSTPHPSGAPSKQSHSPRTRIKTVLHYCNMAHESHSSEYAMVPAPHTTVVQGPIPNHPPQLLHPPQPPATIATPFATCWCPCTRSAYACMHHINTARCSHQPLPLTPGRCSRARRPGCQTRACWCSAACRRHAPPRGLQA